jgi:hypothetical protein
MFRVISLLLGLVGIALFYFGWGLCADLFNCSDVAIAARGVIKPKEVQFIMLLTSVIGLAASFVGIVRGPSSIIPGRMRGVKGRPTDEPMGVRGFSLFGAAAVLTGMVIPLQGLAVPIPEGQSLSFYATVLGAIVVVGYFGWYMSTTHDD